MSTAFEIQKRRKHGKVGQAPGSIIIPEGALAPRVSVISYNKDEIKENSSDGIDQVLDYVRHHPEYTHWVKIKGIGDVDLVKKVGTCLDVNSLVLEDITDTTQRPKYDDYSGFILAISRMVVDNDKRQVFNEQFSILVKGNLLFSFQETYDEYFTGVNQRLQAGNSANPLFTDRDKIYFQDAYDHCIDIIETTGSLKELATNITDVYLATVNNQMNDVMKILTIISSIFIPLTFIAGLYGMNFAHQDPRTGKWLPDNMPELYQPHGYLYALLAMGVIAVLLLIIFWRKGWFDSMR